MGKVGGRGYMVNLCTFPSILCDSKTALKHSLFKKLKDVHRQLRRLVPPSTVSSSGSPGPLCGSHLQQVTRNITKGQAAPLREKSEA